jgi:hypothetical protein
MSRMFSERRAYGTAPHKGRHARSGYLDSLKQNALSRHFRTNPRHEFAHIGRPDRAPASSPDGPATVQILGDGWRPSVAGRAERCSTDRRARPGPSSTTPRRAAGRCPWRRPASTSGPHRPGLDVLERAASSPNEALPMPAWMMPAFSTRNSTAPPLAAFTAAGDVHASPCRPSGSASGRAGRGSYRDGRRAASCRAWRCSGRTRSCRPGPISTRSSAPTMSAPAARGLGSLGTAGEDGDAHRPAGAVRQHADAADHLVGVTRDRRRG